MKNFKKGFTLIELLVVIGIIAILAGIVIVAINPARQFAQARNTQRFSNVTTILNTVGQRLSDNQGIFETGCVAGVIPATATVMGSGVGQYDIAPCVVPTYVSSMPFDPTAKDALDVAAHYTSNTDYYSGYTIIKDATTGRVTISAPDAELEQVIGITR